MHPCLKIPEILSAIFENIINRQYWTTPLAGSATLLNLALTCKMFKDPALDVLWHTIQTLDPLVHCLPADAIRLTRFPMGGMLIPGHGPEEEEEEKEEAEELEDSSDPIPCLRRKKRNLHSKRNLCLKRDLAPIDGYEIQKYSSRVRVVAGPPYWEEASRERSLPPLLDQLFSRLINGPILPLVRIVGPEVDSVRISNQFFHCRWPSDELPWPADLPWDNVRAVIMERLLTLEHFRLDPFRPDFEYRLNKFVSPDIVEVLRSHPSLKVIDVLSLDVDHTAFADLAVLPQLEELAISISTAELLLLYKQRAKSDRFPGLRKLHLHTPDLAACTELIQPPDAFQHLQSLKISGTHYSTWNLKAFFDGIGRHETFAKQLKELRLSIPFFPQDQPRDTTPPVDFPTIERLLSLSNLRNLSLNVDSKVDLDNAALAKMGAAWPHWRSLTWRNAPLARSPRSHLPASSHCFPPARSYGSSSSASTPQRMYRASHTLAHSLALRTPVSAHSDTAGPLSGGHTRSRCSWRFYFLTLNRCRVIGYILGQTTKRRVTRKILWRNVTWSHGLR
ncbi:hypothetical protein FPV67DRAFT_1782072 [Lyophyllum atratum]|nr:hypothetical protein FPV67DRAFT_1782072 [Lyophyllum atratum]